MSYPRCRGDLDHDSGPIHHLIIELCSDLLDDETLVGIKELKTTDEPRRSKAQLPTWPGKVIGSLHRSDIYDDLH